MSSQKPSIPKGTRDFTPAEMLRRNFIFDTIRDVFQRFGFQPIETPAMENLSVLLGKYGDEGDKLLFRILNSGDFLSGATHQDLQLDNAQQLSLKISNKGLRYDLTVPFARYVVQHRNEISFPFKRYQIQPVWRADRPQRGRYREFYQCDADIIGSDSLVNEVELIQLVEEIFVRLGINVQVKLNNRKILAGIAQAIGAEGSLTDITIAIDKLDKIGQEKVNEELAQKGLSAEAIDKLQPILLMQGSDEQKFDLLHRILAGSAIGITGIAEMQEIFETLRHLELRHLVSLDLTLARGLNYYTGAIIEVKAADVQIGSICGGGRYDDLTGIFGMPGTSGVGISFGADRIYDVMLESNLFGESSHKSTQVLFVNFGKAEERYCLTLLNQVRKAGISAELYPEATKMKKQMTWADKKEIAWVVLVGKEEMENNQLTLKNMHSGEQISCNLAQMINRVKDAADAAKGN
jgi:histidyl-tRNA synthetase